MFIQPTKKTTLVEVKPLNLLTAVLSADLLLADPKRKTTLTTIATLSEFEAPLFDALCLGLIHQVANHCQRLPGHDVYYGFPGGLLDYALARTQAALQLFRQYLIPTPSEALSDEQKRWWYALFSASLLRGLGTLSLDYHIDLYNLKGQFLKPWNPLLESLSHACKHYAFELKTSEDAALRRRLTLLLAKQLMPAQGFAWIASNPETLATWLALLDDDIAAAGAFGAVLDRADAIAIQNDLHQFPLSTPTNPGEKQTRINTFVDNPQPTDALLGKEHLIGIEFIRWLENKLHTQKFPLNQNPIFYVPGGLLVCIEAFQLFIKEHGWYKNWQAIQKGVLALKLHRPGERGTPISRHEQGNGIVISGSIALPESFSIKNPHTQTTTKTTAIALALADHAKRLTPQGTWVIPEPITPSTQFKPKPPHGR